VQLVEGVGAKAAEELAAGGISMIGDLIRATNLPPRHQKHQVAARQQYQGLY